MTFEKLHETLKDLPVATVAQDLVNSVQAGKVAVLTSDTGSGKTLYANTLLADQTDGQVVVLVPRRFLATNAAETVAELAEVDLGKEVGFAVGRQSGDKSQFSDDTKLLFATYGYAISSGLLMNAKTIVADEVHEAGIDTSLARAILHRRMATDSTLRVVEMSATIDATKQAGYWQDPGETSIHQADGKTFPCENRFINPKEKSLAQTTIDLIQNDGRKGIAVFKPGKQECEDEANAIRALAGQNGIEIEVSTIYGEMDSQQRRAATRAPKEGVPKVIIGTNVIESGVNIAWLDAGISDGTGKILHYNQRTGAKALKLEDLPQWRITQQEGRVKRFQPGIFVLHSATAFNERPERTIPEIERAPLTELVMHCAALKLNPEELKFDSDIDRQKLINARKNLERLGLITNEYALTEAGQYVSNLPVGPETGAMLWEAKKQGKLNDALELAAVMEAGGLRANFKMPHGLDSTSDMLDSLKAFREFRLSHQNRDVGNQRNISWKRFNEAKELLSDLRRRHNNTELDANNQASDDDLRILMLAGGLGRLMQASFGSYRDLARNQGAYQMGRFSTVGGDTPFVVADLREIPTKRGSFTVLESATAVPPELLVKFAAERKDVFSEPSFEPGIGRDLIRFRYFNGAEIEFYTDLMPKNIYELIEPAYSKFRHQENVKHLLNALSPKNQESHVARDMAEKHGDLSAAVSHIAQEYFLKSYNLPAQITLGSQKSLTKENVRLGSLTVASGPQSHQLNIDVERNSLTAEQLKYFLEESGTFNSFGGDSGANGNAHAFEIRSDGTIALHTTSAFTDWKDQAGRALQEVAAEALQTGYRLEMVSAIMVSRNLIKIGSSPVLTNHSQEYAPEDQEKAQQAVTVFGTRLEGYSLEATASGTIEYSKNRRADQFLLAPERAGDVSKLEADARQVYEEIQAQVDQRKQQVRDTKQALSNAGFESVSLDGYSSYSHAQFEQISGAEFSGKVDALLELREQLERAAEPDTTFTVQSTNFSNTSQIILTVVYEGTDSLPDKDALIKRLREIDPAIRAFHLSGSTSNNQEIFSFTVPAISSADNTFDLAQKLAAHQERLAAIPAKRDVYWQQMAETARVAEEDRLTELQKQIPILEQLIKKGGSLPADFKQYVTNDKYDWDTPEANSGNSEIDKLLLALRKNGCSDMTASEMLANFQEKERLAQQQAHDRLEELKIDLQWLHDNEIGVPENFAMYLTYGEDGRYSSTHEDPEIAALLSEMATANGTDCRRLPIIKRDLEQEIALQEKMNGRRSTDNLLSSAMAKALQASHGATLASTPTGSILKPNEGRQSQAAEAERIAAMDQKWTEFQQTVQDIAPALEALRTLGADTLPQEFAPYVTTYDKGNACFTAWGSKRNEKQDKEYADLRAGGVSEMCAADLLVHVTQQRAAEMLEHTDAILDALEGNAPLSADFERYTHLDPALLKGDAADLVELLQEHQDKTAVAEQEAPIEKRTKHTNFVVPESVRMMQVGASR